MARSVGVGLVLVYRRGPREQPPPRPTFDAIFPRRRLRRQRSRLLRATSACECGQHFYARGRPPRDSC